MLAQIVTTAAAATCLSLAAVAWSRYRDTRDPHALFLSAGFLVVGVQCAWVVAWRYRNPIPLPFVPTSHAVVGPVARTPLYALQVGWLVAGAAFLLGLPWWERRGHPVNRAAVVMPALLAIVVAADVAIVVSFRDPVGTTSPGVGWLLALGATALLGAAAVRELGTGRVWHRWLAAAYGLAALFQISILRNPTPGRSAFQPADWLLLVAPAVAFAGLLAAQRAEASRMRRASDRASEVMDGRAEIASMVAHEVRGPVATIRGLAGSTLANYDRLSDEERREFVGLIAQESGRLMGSVDQSSLALKVDAGTLTVAVRDDDVGAAVREGVAAAGSQEHPVAIIVEPGIRARIDRKWVAEIVRQLVDNAAKFSPPTAPIRVDMRRENGTVAIEVTDRGPGIPPENREQVFTKFPNVRPAGYEAQPGSGLGLFICRGLVAEHHGEIVVDDAAGGGTMLRVRLPVEG